MGINLGQALGLHPAALKLRGERAQVLASNLANENTPGYQARDLDFRARLDEAALGASGTLPSFQSDATLYRVPSRPPQDGNTVELGVEQAEFAQNALDFQTSLTFVNMKLKGLGRGDPGQRVSTMSFKQSVEIAGSAMAAQTVRMNTIASNLANADTAGTADSAYVARKPVFASVFNGLGARVQVLDVVTSQDPLESRHEPGNPLADENGMVFYSNVNPVGEMADMLAASRAYSTNVEVLVRLNGMQQAVLKMGEGA